MQPFAWNFDATKVEPSQGGGAHPVGNKFPFTITGVEVVEIKDKSGGMLVVELTSPAGSIRNNYNMWNSSDQARDIAHKQLSALCHAVGIFQIGANQGKELIGGKGMMDIGFQKGHEPSAEKPAGGYVEVKKIYDVSGNEPGKAPINQPQSNGFAPSTAQQQPQANGAAPAIQSGWPTSQAAASQMPAGQQAQPAAGWQQNGNGGTPAAPPWGSR